MYTGFPQLQKPEAHGQMQASPRLAGPRPPADTTRGRSQLQWCMSPSKGGAPLQPELLGSGYAGVGKRSDLSLL